MTKQSPIIGGMDDVFKALADPTRRSLLDNVIPGDDPFVRTRSRRCRSTPSAMKHLKLAEEAGLVATRRRAGAKLHFLNQY